MIAIPKEARAECITGDLGGGKTATFVEYAYLVLSLGGWVFTNVQMYYDKIGQRLADEGLIFEPERLVQLTGETMADFYKQLKRGSEGQLVLCGIDEAQLDMHTKDRAKQDQELYNFMAMCRKLEIWMVLIAHDANEIDINIRRKFTIETTCRNLKEQMLFDVIPFPIPVYFRVRFKLYQGKVHHKISSEYYMKSPAWGLYNSKALLGAKAKVFEAMAVAQGGRLKKIQKAPALWGPAAAAAAIVALSIT